MFVESYTSRELASFYIAQSLSERTDYHSKAISWQGQKVRVRFWQQTEQERPFTTRLFRNADGVIYMIDTAKSIREIGAGCEEIE